MPAGRYRCETGHAASAIDGLEAKLVKEAAQRAASSAQVDRFLLLARIHPAVIEFCEGPGPALEKLRPE